MPEMKLQSQSDFIRLFAELGQRFNSYYHLNLQIENILDGQVYPLKIGNQFLSVQMRFPEFSGLVAYWSFSKTEAKSIENISEIEFYGQNEVGRKYVDFYLPTDLFNEFPEIVKALGNPAYLCKGILSSSGRSIWVFHPQKVPICIKIDTMEFFLPKKFSARPLLKTQIQHSIVMDKLLQVESNFFNESDGLSFSFFSNSESIRRYSYLSRRLDFSKGKYQKEDFLIPMQAILSKEFWRDHQLLKLLKLDSRDPVEFFKSDLARGFADMIKNSLDFSHVHFEIHQQNLSLHLRHGKLIKLVYHDLLDTVFDPIGYFIDHLSFEDHKNMAAIDRISEVQKNVFFNSHGVMQRGDFQHFAFTISSFYRRYIRNFGDYNKILNLYTGNDYLYCFDFENAILKYLNFTEESLDLNEVSPDERGFLSNQLYWCIDRYYRCRQNRRIKVAFELLNKIAKGIETKLNLNSDLLSKLENSFAIASVNFPNRAKDIKVAELDSIGGCLNDKVFFGTYSKLPFIIVFPTISEVDNKKQSISFIF